jgi:predicted PurR-regulated permease PerM
MQHIIRTIAVAVAIIVTLFNASAAPSMVEETKQLRAETKAMRAQIQALQAPAALAKAREQHAKASARLQALQAAAQTVGGVK